ncbi:MAG: hypothetical protein KUA38_01935 [Hydrogenophaga sp.]|nr:hypothetical protein [Hydrogenophaga sp.]
MIAIYEPLWQPGQKLMENAFLPLPILDNSSAAWREFRIFVDFYRRGEHLKSGMTGIFSPKFRRKTKVSGSAFIEFVQQHSDADVCMINPFPMLPYYSYNVWMQGEIIHPGLVQRAQSLLDAAGIGWDLSLTPRHNQNNLLYSNFWVGTPAFWELYVGGVLNPIACFIEDHPESEVVRSVLQETSYLVAAPFLPFIVERLFSTYLSLHPEVRVVPYPMGENAALDYCLTDFQRTIVSHMIPLVKKADALQCYPVELIEKQRLFCKLAKKYNDVYFSVNKHPHLIELPVDQ